MAHLLCCGTGRQAVQTVAAGCVAGRAVCQTAPQAKMRQCGAETGQIDVTHGKPQQRALKKVKRIGFNIGQNRSGFTQRPQ